MTWLIAEDEADIRNLIVLMCQVWGHTTLAFENGQKVWDWLDTVEQGQTTPLPELILMDIRMPGKKGNEIAQRMRTIAPLERTPIVLMTAFSLNERERSEMMSNDGVDHILNKPLPDFEQLRTTLTDIIQQKQTSAQEKPASAPVTVPETPEAAPDAKPDAEPSTEQQSPVSEVQPSPTQAEPPAEPLIPETQTKTADPL
ncbi:MAG: response regulator [Chloroflexota bacterium]